MRFEHTTLDNGLTVVAEVNDAAASMAAGFFVRTGSRDETGDVAGVSHFLEHMIFKGTDRRSAFDVNLDFDRMGANYNAFTSEENTVFYGAVLPEYQDRLLDLLCDILRPSLREEDFTVEKNVILDEIALYQDMPKFRVYDNLMTAHFTPHPLGNSILGTPQSITDLPVEKMREYFARRYAPDNITMVGVGKLDFQTFAEHVSRLCGHWKPAQARRELGEPAAATTTAIIHDKKVLREHVGLMSSGPSHQADERYAAELLADIMGDSTGSRLYYALVEPAIADEASMAFAPMDGAGAFMTFISADAEKAGEALTIARAELKRFVDEGPTAAELQAAKNKIATGATLKGELPMGRLSAVGADWVYRTEYVPLSEQIEALLSVTQAAVHDVARNWKLDETTIYALGPLEKL